MDQQQNQARGRSPSAAGHQQPPHINPQGHAPSPAASNIGLGLGLDAQQYPSSQPDFSTYNGSSSNNNNNGNNAFIHNPDIAFDPNQPFTDQLKSDNQFAQGSFLNSQPNFGDDFTIFPASSAEQINAPLFASDGSPQPQHQQLGTPDMNAMATHAHHSPTPPHLLKPEPHQPGSAHQSPSFNAHQFSSPAGRHSRNASLGPEAALMPHQVADWSGAQFQGHRRTPSEFSDVSSVGGHSPALVAQDTFPDHIEHSPMQRPQDAGVYQELHGIGSFSISDGHINRARSPSHSPAISPRILPQSLPDMSQANNAFMQNNGFAAQGPYMQAPEAFPALPTTTAEMSQPMSQIEAPTINVIEAPGGAQTGFVGKSVMDTDALSPPDQRGKSQPWKA